MLLALVVPGHLLFNALIALLQGDGLGDVDYIFGSLYMASWWVMLLVSDERKINFRFLTQHRSSLLPPLHLPTPGALAVA
jgi:hypothetical protein